MIVVLIISRTSTAKTIFNVPFIGWFIISGIIVQNVHSLIDFWRPLVNCQAPLPLANFPAQCMHVFDFVANLPPQVLKLFVSPRTCIRTNDTEANRQLRRTFDHESWCQFSATLVLFLPAQKGQQTACLSQRRSRAGKYFEPQFKFQKQKQKQKKKSNPSYQKRDIKVCCLHRWSCSVVLCSPPPPYALLSFFLIFS